MRGPGRTARAALAGGAIASLIAAGLAGCGSPRPARPGPSYAAVDAPGPPLSVAPASLRAALSCQPTVAHASVAPVLLVPGTTVNPSEFSWNWEPALTKLGIPWCTIDLPDEGLGDIQTAGEYVVYAIRTMYRRAARRIDIVGHSQGGMVPRWALRFWPDTRAMVDDLVGLSPSNNGTFNTHALCSHGCAPAIWQQSQGSRFLAALNSGQETFPGISYTNIYTVTDSVVPDAGLRPLSALTGGGGAITNVAIQDVCPNDRTGHLGIGTYDNTAFAIALDALAHAGPADPARVPRSVCNHRLMPGLHPRALVRGLAAADALAARAVVAAARIPAEPPLACYVTASCQRAHRQL